MVSRQLSLKANSGRECSILMGKKQSVSLRRLAMPTLKIPSLQFVDPLKRFRKSLRSYNTMPVYECNEHQFVENIRRLIETSQKFLVNRRITWHDDARYGPAILPDDEFDRYAMIAPGNHLGQQFSLRFHS